MRLFSHFFETLLGCICISASVFSQTLQLYTENNTLLNYGDTITLTGTPQTSELSISLKVKNTSSSNVQVWCIKEYVSVISGTSNTFCWANTCFPPTTFSSPNMWLYPDTMTDGFSAHYYPNNNIGVSIIKYTFHVVHGDTAWIIIKFIIPTTINGNYVTSKLFNPFPNPASSNVTVPVYLPSVKNAVLEVYDVCGKIKNKILVQSNSSLVNIPVSSYPEGIYFVQLHVNGIIAGTEKFVVKR